MIEFIWIVFRFYRHEKSGNADLINALSRWVFKEEGVLRVKSVKHHLANEKEPPASYTITEPVVSDFYFQNLIFYLASTV